MNTTLCDIVIPDAKYHNDILHPCIRYSPRKVLGHHWWLIASPWYKRDDKIENPILFYGVEESKGVPPTQWIYYQVIQDSHEQGYNSDPSICIHDDNLYAIWREVETPRLRNLNLISGIFIKKVSPNNNLVDCEKLILTENHPTHLSDLSPVILVDDNSCDVYTIYHKRSTSIFYRILCKIARLVGIKRYASKTLGIYHRRITSDLSVSDIGCYPICMNPTHIPWHFDLMFWGARKIILLYCEFEKNIYIGELIGHEVQIQHSPLSINLGINSTYKPTGIILANTLWLYYTDKKNARDPYLNELYLSSFNLNLIFNTKQ